jgi:hypothetical protein
MTNAMQLFNLNNLGYKTTKFNCFSFAVGVYTEWLVPSNWKKYAHNDNLFINGIKEEFATNEYLAKNFSFVGIFGEDIQFAQLELGKEYIFARMEESNDFHFVRRLADGTYLHKAGGSDIEHFDPAQLLADNWTWRYSSKVATFVRLTEEKEIDLEAISNTTEKEEECDCPTCRRMRFLEFIDNNNNNNNNNININFNWE